MSGPEHIVSCACGAVQLRASADPILSAVCYCRDCQEGGRQMEAAGVRADFRDSWGGTPYLTYRNDRIVAVNGADLVRGFKLKPDAPTTRYATTCCNTALYLKFGPGWWTSLYRVRFGDAAPALEMRNKIRFAQNPATLPRDVPAYRNFPLTMLWRLMCARIAMWLHI